jgi:malyl-CoA/(S)-citramalyl-CoA lyase
MSFTQVGSARSRISRSYCFILTTDPSSVDAAARSVADAVMFELEDAIPPEQKSVARKTVLEALNDIDWGEKTVSARISGLDSPFMYRDLIDVLEGPSERLDMVMIPKVGAASDVYAVDMLVTQLEQATERTNPVGLEVMIETALGMANINEIAGSSTRLEALHLGENDYATSMGMEVEVFGGPHSEYSVLTGTEESERRDRHWNDPWHYALCRVATTARAHGLRPMDVGFINPSDPEGFFAAARRAAVLGFEGKWANNEEQVKLANEAFTPSNAAIEKAQRIVEAARANTGARRFELDGKPILMPQIRDAEALLEKARKMGLQV